MGEAVVEGEGVDEGFQRRAGRAQRLRQVERAGAPGIECSFRYFQLVEGDIVLPRGIRPVRVVVRLLPASGAPVEQSFTWSAATAPAGG